MALVSGEELAAQGRGFYALPVVRQLGLMVGLAASVALGVAIVFWSQSPDYRLLYSNLADQDAGEIVQALQQAGVEYRLSDSSGTIMVPAADVSSARLMLAGEGLPKGSGAGFEMLDNQDGFGLSQFMENARYQRALEGELTRTITALDSVRSARVHLAIPKQTAFVRRREKAKASITVDLLPGRLLQDGQVAAISHMVAASVPGLESSEVMIIDQHGRLLTKREQSEDMQLTANQFDYRKRLENSYVKSIQSLISPLVGDGRVRAQVTADMDFTRTEKTQERFDPTTASLRSEHIEEQQQAGMAALGVPGSLSNQPPLEGSAAAEQTAENLRSRRSTKNYELDKTISHVRQGSARVERLSVAVVIDYKSTKNEDGEIVQTPLSSEEMDRITALVRRAVGFDAERGDQVEVVNAPFSLPELPEAVVTEPGFLEQPIVREMAKQGLAVLAILYLLFGVLKPAMRSLATAGKEEEKRLLQPQASDVIPEDQLTLSAPGQPAGASGPDHREEEPVPTLEERIETVKGLAGEDPKRVAQVVNNWLVTEQ